MRTDGLPNACQRGAQTRQPAEASSVFAAIHQLLKLIIILLSTYLCVLDAAIGRHQL
jgi:hypothetical protein